MPDLCFKPSKDNLHFNIANHVKTHIGLPVIDWKTSGGDWGGGDFQKIIRIGEYIPYICT